MRFVAVLLGLALAVAVGVAFAPYVLPAAGYLLAFAALVVAIILVGGVYDWLLGRLDAMADAGRGAVIRGWLRLTGFRRSGR